MKKLIYLFLLISFVSFPQDFDRKKYKTARKNGNQAHKKLLNQDYYGAIALCNNVVENYYYSFQVQRAYEGRGFAKFELEDYKGAVEDFTEAIEYERAENSILFSLPYPSDIKQTELYLVNDAKDIVELYLKSSYSKYKLGDNKGACEDARKVQEFRNEFPNEIELPKLPNNYDTSDLIKSVCEEINITSKPKSNPFNTNDNNLYNPLESVSEKFKNDDYYGAILDYTKAININPNLTDAFVLRGIAKYYLGDKNGSCKDAHKLQELGYDATALIETACN